MLPGVRFIESSVVLKLKCETVFDVSSRQVLNQLLFSLLGLLLVVKVGRDDAEEEVYKGERQRGDGHYVAARAEPFFAVCVRPRYESSDNGSEAVADSVGTVVDA